MDFSQYQELSKRTMPKNWDGMTISNYAMGLAGEAGEVVDLLKKWVHHQHPITQDELDKLVKELGDVQHYANGIATMFKISMNDVVVANVEKLKKRYPEGFSPEKSINREE